MVVSNANPDSTKTLLDLLWVYEKRHQHRRSMIFHTDRGEISWTFKDLLAHSSQVAYELIQKGASKGQRAVLTFPPGLEFAAAFFGCQMAGLIPVPASYPKGGAPTERLTSIAKDCEPAWLMSTPSVFETTDFSSLPVQTHSISSEHLDSTFDFESLQNDFCLPEWNEIAFLQYTSGSTRSPRGVKVSHRNLIHNLKSIRDRFRIPRESSHEFYGVFWLPLFHDMGLIGGLLTPLFVGATSVWFSPQAFMRRPMQWLELITRYRASFTGGPNFAYQLAFDRIDPAQVQAFDLSSLKTAFCGAEPICERSLVDFSRRFSSIGFRPDAFLPCYGLAEGTLLVTAPHGSGPLETIRLEKQAWQEGHVCIEEKPLASTDSQVLVACGQAIADTDVLVVDPKTRIPCEPRTIGEVWVRGPSVASGYWNSHDETAAQTFDAELADGNGRFLRTGDLGFFENDQLYLAGRRKDLLIVRGRNLYSHDIENAVRGAIPEARQIAVFASEGIREEAIVVLVELRPTQVGDDSDAIVRQIRRTVIDAFEVDPHHVLLVRPGAIPVTTSGKLDRSNSKSRFQNEQLETIARYDAPKLASRVPLPMPEWDADKAKQNRDCTRLEFIEWSKQWLITRGGIAPSEIDPAKPLVVYGLDSMMAMEMSGEIESWSGVRFEPNDSTSYPTLDDLADTFYDALVGASDVANPR